MHYSSSLFNFIYVLTGKKKKKKSHMSEGEQKSWICTKFKELGYKINAYFGIDLKETKSIK